MTETRAPRIENVLLLTVDCLRADRFVESVEAGRLDAMDRLWTEGVRFPNAFTVANTTDPSLASFLSASYPHTHGVEENGWGLPEDRPVLAEAARDAGRSTFAVVSVDHLNDEHSGFGRGFDAYHDSSSYDLLYPITSRVFDTRLFNLVFGAVKDLGTERVTVKTLLRDLGLIRLHSRPASAVTADALDAIDAAEPPFCGWVHYFDMHEPRNFDRADRDRHDEYTASMLTVDEHVGRVIDALEDAGVRDETLVVLTGDHGEALGDHSYTGHGRTLYDEELNVPLTFHHPDLSGATHDAQVRTIDVAPTILDLLDAPIPDAFEGAPLLDSAPADRPVFATAYPEFTDAVCVRDDGWKLIRTDEGEELYDLTADPDETDDLADASGDAAAQRESLRHRLADWRAAGRDHERQEVDDATREMLDDLGYVD